MNSTTRREHINYLRQTLIPDLVESGRLATAVDFEVCCRFMETHKEYGTDIQEYPENALFDNYLNEWRGRV